QRRGGERRQRLPGAAARCRRAGRRHRTAARSGGAAPRIRPAVAGTCGRAVRPARGRGAHPRPLYAAARTEGDAGAGWRRARAAPGRMRTRMTIKRILDATIAAAALVVAGPVILAAALAVKLTSHRRSMSRGIPI